jgi:hypothetical protein
MRVPLIVVATILVMSAAAFGPATTPRTSAGAEPRTAVQGQQADFQRPDVAPLPAEGKFQVVSASGWPGDKVRLFFLGAQF